jgi:hypothetical protein
LGCAGSGVGVFFGFGVGVLVGVGVEVGVGEAVVVGVRILFERSFLIDSESTLFLKNLLSIKFAEIYPIERKHAIVRNIIPRFFIEPTILIYFIIFTNIQELEVKIMKVVTNQLAKSPTGILNIRYTGKVKNIKDVPIIRSAK